MSAMIEERIKSLENQVCALQAAIRLMGGKPADGSLELDRFIMDTIRMHFNLTLPDSDVGRILRRAEQHMLDEQNSVQHRVNQVRANGGCVG